ncbi:MAG TPA: AI-2E family transporter [Candidatus Absconditabacterales bacterium]|nr:AI-2E family transporter [Candidatus Absconditabacterales bacterium]
MKLKSNYLFGIKTFLKNKFNKVKNKIDSNSKELNKKDGEFYDMENTNQKDKSNIENSFFSGFSDKKIIKFWLFALLIGLLGYFVYNTLNIIFLIIGAYIISIIVESLIFPLQSIGIKRGLAIVLAYIIFLIFLAGLLVFVIPFLLSQFAELVSIGVRYMSGFQDVLANSSMSEIISNTQFLPDYAKEYILDYFAGSDVLVQIQSVLQNNISQIINTGKDYVQILGFVVVDFVSGLTSAIANFAIFITLSILFSVEKDQVIRFIARLSGKEKYDTTLIKMKKVYKKLAVWLKARLLMSLFITLAMWLALVIMSWFGLDMPNKFGLSLIAGLLDIIPYIGPFISGALFFIIGLIYNTVWAAILGVGSLWGVNLVQNNILTPLFMNRALGVNSVLIFISMIIGGMIMGFLGVLLAVPIAVIITLFTQNKKELEKDDDQKKEGFFKNIMHKKE